MRIPGKNIAFAIVFFSITVAFSNRLFSQSITGVWRGKISQQRFGPDKLYQVELKLIRNGDSLTGTSYYFSSENNYYRFAVKGYFDPSSGFVIWWDEQLIETFSSKRRAMAAEDGLKYTADFNCPGEGIMKLDGKAEKKNETQENPMAVHLSKMPAPIFGDEWDFVIDNFALGANDPSFIDSIENLHAGRPIAINTPTPAKEQEKDATDSTSVGIVTPVAPAQVIRQPVQESPAVPAKISVAKSPPSIMEKFVSRKKSFVTEIPISGDSIEINFYDHAEIDGDSISLFLNNKLIHEHILLKASPFTIKLATSDLANNNELIMVAENLGSIPPNTSLMILYVNGQRHEARLESTENESAMIRFVKKQN